MENIDKAPRHSLIGTSSPKGSLKFKFGSWMRVLQSFNNL